MAYRVYTTTNRHGQYKKKHTKWGSPGYGWHIDTEWYDNDPQYRGALDEMIRLGIYDGLAYGRSGNATEINTFSSKHNLMKRLQGVEDWLRGGRAAYYNAQAAKAAPPPPPPAEVTTPPPIQPTRIDVSSVPKPVPGPPPTSTPSIIEISPEVYEEAVQAQEPARLIQAPKPAPAPKPTPPPSGSGAYEQQGVRSARNNPRRKSVKISSFGRGRRPISLQTVNV